MFPRFIVVAALTVFLCFYSVAEADPVKQDANLSKEELDKQFLQAQGLQNQGKKPDAIAFYERILPSAERIYGKDSLNTATLLTNLATLHHELRQYAKAEPLYQRGLQIREAKLGKDHVDVSQSLNNLATLYADLGQHTKAEPLYRRSLQIREATLAKDDIRLDTTVSSLASLYIVTGEYKKAEPLFVRSVQIREAKLGKEHPYVARALNSLANLYFITGQTAKVEPLYQRSLQINETKFGKDHPEVAISLNNLALISQYNGQFARAESLLLRSLQIEEAKLGKDHPSVARALNNLGTLYVYMGQHAKAEPLQLRSLHIRETKLGPTHSDVADSLNNLALLYQQQGQYAKAEPLYVGSLRINEIQFGKNHLRVAHAYHNLASLYRDLGQFAKAEPLFLHSLRIYEATFGKAHTSVTDSLGNLAWNFAAQKEWTKAVEQTHKARQGIALHLTAVLPTLSEREQLNLLQANFESAFHRALALGLIAGNEATAASAEWLLNGQAIAHQSLAEQQILSRDAKDPKAKRLVEDLQNTRTRLAALLNRTAKPGLENAYQTEMQNLRTNEQDLAQKLARAVGRAYRANPWVSLDELRGKLGPKTAFVNIARFPMFDFEKSKWQSPRYVAWITPPTGKDAVQLIDLGDAETIDQLIKLTRKTLLDSSKSINTVGQVEAAEVLQKPLHALSAKVLHPLLPALEKYDEWIVCPDGALWLTPWHALLLPKGEFAVEKHLIRHVVSGRDLVLELPKTQAQSAYVFADPDYDLSPSKVMALASQQSQGDPQQINKALGKAINAGVVLYNQKKDFEGCCQVYRTSLLAARTDLAGRPELQKRIDQGLAKSNGVANPAERAVALRAVVDALRQSLRDLAPIRNEDSRNAGSVLATIAKVPRLPGTGMEAQAIRPKLQQWLGQAPKVFTDGRASEALLKTIKNPRVLTLATHGYFLSTQDADVKAPPGLETGDRKPAIPLLDKTGQPIENPLLRCGLLLAGCNQRADAKPGEDDGILTGLEIVGMDLNGCELVVLSACETGLGDVRSGEGVAGLRQAFQLAGAKSVLASLWQVPDRDTALLMNTFYGQLANGRTQTQALRQAQLQRIASQREQFGAAHPFFWAAFTLTNRGSD